MTATPARVERAGELARLGRAAEDQDHAIARRVCAVRRLLVIGIGAGDPEHVTAQAVRALNEVDVFFVVDKGGDTEDLVALRRRSASASSRIRPTGSSKCPTRRATARPAPTPERSTTGARGAPTCGARRCATSSARTSVGGFLVWGDPSLYDSTIDVIERILAAGASPSSTR